MDKLFSNVVWGWLGRRVLDWGGWLGVIATGLMAFYAQMPPAQQASVGKLFTGNWQDITLGTLVPLIVLIFSQVLSFRATMVPQVVTAEGEKQIVTSAAGKKDLKVVAKEEAAKPKKPTILENLFGKK